MAEAERTEVERVIKEEGVILKLTMPEAETLKMITYRIGGDPWASPSKHAYSIHVALGEVGVKGAHLESLVTGAICFKDYPEAGE